MPNKLNQLLYDQMKKGFAEIDNLLLVDYRGLNSEKMAQFRSKLRESGLQMEVVKNSIFKLAVKELPAKALIEDPKGALGGTDPFSGPIGVIFGGETVIDSARFAVEWLKANENTISLKAALMGSEVFPANQIVALSKLPSRKELLGLMANVVQSPIQKLAATVQASYARILWAFMALEEKLENKV